MRLLDDGVRNAWVLEDMLADIGIELEDIVLRDAVAGPIVRRARRAAALPVFYFGHVRIMRLILGPFDMVL